MSPRQGEMHGAIIQGTHEGSLRHPPAASVGPRGATSESEKRQAKDLADVQVLDQERLDGLMSLIETLQKDDKVCAGVSRNADPSVSVHKDQEGKKSAKMLVDDHHAGVSGMRSASDNVSGSPEPVPDLELTADFDAGEKRPQQPKTYSAFTASEELGSSKTVLAPSPPPLENNVTESSRHTTTTARTSCSPQAAAENTTSDSTNAWQQVKRRGKKSSRGPSPASTSPASTKRQCEQEGATRIKKSVFYISGIDVSCPEDTPVDYCLSRQVRVASCRFLNSKHFGAKSARLVVSAEDAEATNIVNESFWPENIRARPWKFPETPPDRKDEHPRWLKARS